MRPEDIQNQDFLVGLRGYDKDEVRTFLAQVAQEHASVLAELDQVRTTGGAPAPAAAAPADADDFENLGASVAAVLRAAKDSAAEVVAAAEQRREAIQAAADEALRRANAEAEEIRATAAASIDDANR